MATPPNIIYHWKTYHTHSCTTLSLAHLLTCFRYWNFGVAISSWHRTGCVKGGCFYFVIFNFLKPWYIMVHLVIKCYKGQFCCSFPTTGQKFSRFSPKPLVEVLKASIFVLKPSYPLAFYLPFSLRIRLAYYLDSVTSIQFPASTNGVSLEREWWAWIFPAIFPVI